MTAMDGAARESLQKKGVAYHEAGHATVARHGSGDFASVQIEMGKKEWKGSTAAAYGRNDVTGRGEYFAAGTIAQKRGAPGSSIPLQEQGDINEIERLANDNIGNKARIGQYASAEDKRAREALKNQVTKAAEAIIEEHWDEVEKIAEALLERGKLTKDEVDDLLK